jgi:hypothetical protein
MNQFERDILDKTKEILRKTVDNTDINVDIEESEDEIIHAYYDNIGDYEGAFMAEVDFLAPYKGKAVEAIQLFSTLAIEVNEQMFPVILEKLNELNAMTIYGSFGLFPDGKQIFHRYTMPMPNNNIEINAVNLQNAWDEIWSTIIYFLPYILVLSNSGDIMDIDDYMEAMNGAN